MIATKIVQNQLLDFMHEVDKKTLMENAQNSNTVKRLISHAGLSSSYLCNVLNTTARLKDFFLLIKIQNCTKEDSAHFKENWTNLFDQFYDEVSVSSEKKYRVQIKIIRNSISS
jgi:DNA repair ATPase RecN